MDPALLHKTQVSILHTLRYAPTGRFNELMKPTGHTSDTFKFHLRKLVKLGYVEKLSHGNYQLTNRGKEYANVLHEQKRTVKKQPKIAVMLLVARQFKGETQYLLYKRKVNPFYGYWAAMSDAVLWGETFEEAAYNRLKKHAGYEADFTVKSSVRIRNFVDEEDSPSEDILFVIMEAFNLRGEPHSNYAGGVPEWLSMSKLLEQDKFFPLLIEILKNEDGNHRLLEIDSVYPHGEF